MVLKCIFQGTFCQKKIAFLGKGLAATVCLVLHGSSVTLLRQKTPYKKIDFLTEETCS